MVTHPSTNRIQRKFTVLIEANVPSLQQTAAQKNTWRQTARNQHTQHTFLPLWLWPSTW